MTAIVKNICGGKFMKFISSIQIQIHQHLDRIFWYFLATSAE